jgi:hypothetical protein
MARTNYAFDKRQKDLAKKKKKEEKRQKKLAAKSDELANEDLPADEVEKND